MITYNLKCWAEEIAEVGEGAFLVLGSPRFSSRKYTKLHGLRISVVWRNGM